MTLTRVLAGVALSALAATAAQADGFDIKEFRIGILGGENQADRLNSHACVREAASKKFGVEAKLFAPADYNGVIEGLLGGTLDMAWVGASGYAKAYLEDKDAVEPILTPINPDGSTGYYSIGFARVDKKIASLDDMKDRVFAFGDPNSTSGFLIPSIEIPAAGYSMDEGAYFDKIAFSGGHEQTIVGVYNGDFDGGVTWADGVGEWEDGFNNGALRKAVDAGLVDMTEMQEIWRSNLIPNGPLVVRKSLPQDVKLAAIEMVLNDLGLECLYGLYSGEVIGSTMVTHENYASVVAARAKKIGK